MKTPDTIYIRTYPYDNSICPEWLKKEGINSGVISRGVVLYEDIPYIRKDAILDWLKGCKANPEITDLQKGNIQEIIDKINSI